jgi:argininosuccinate synthase
VDVAREVGADAVSHGCTGKGNDQACPLQLKSRFYDPIKYFCLT